MDRLHVYYSFSICRRRRPHRFRRDEGPRCGTGPPSVVRQPRQDCGSSMQLPSPSHPSHPASTDDRTRSHTGVQSDTVSIGLLQRCVEWSSNGQYSEAAARAEHCSTDRPPSTATDACSATTRTFTLATGSTADRLQAGRANVQSTQHWDTIIPQPSHQTKDIYTSSTLFIALATTETHHQDTYRRSRFSLHCTYCLELSEQLHCR